LLLWSGLLEKTSPAKAWLPLYLFIQYRTENGWPLPEELTDTTKRVRCPFDMKNVSYKELLVLVDALAIERAAQFKPDKQGNIKNIREKFGFIHGDDNQDTFFSLGNYTGPRPWVGLRVCYRVKRAYDRRKKRASPEAYDVQAIPPKPIKPGLRPGISTNRRYE
jgi:hypothetical protein